MTRRRTGAPYVGVTWSDEQVRQHSADALRYAMKKAGGTRASMARWCRVRGKPVGETTMGTWLAGKVAPNIWAILRSGRLRRHFIEYMRVCDLKDAA